MRANGIEEEYITGGASDYEKLGKLYAELDWEMQFHINAHRNNNNRMFKILGPDTGYDSINDDQIAKPLVKILDSLEQENKLPKTIIYSLNPGDNVVIASIINSFQNGRTPGKVQFGTAWWFNDTKEGMLEQMKALSSVGRSFQPFHRNAKGRSDNGYNKRYC
jgi:glucuronate isomerase